MSQDEIKAALHHITDIDKLIEIGQEVLRLLWKRRAWWAIHDMMVGDANKARLLREYHSGGH
jgi:hypothetical protein